MLKTTTGLKNPPGYAFWLKKLKNGIGILLKPTTIKLQANPIKIYQAVYICEKEGFLHQVQTMLVYYLKANRLHIIKKLIYFSDSCGGQCINYKNFMDLCSINKYFAKCYISVNECFIRKAKTQQYSYFWLPNLHYLF